jgi:histone deacetylase 6
LYTTHDMMQIPLMTEYLEQRLGTQIMCTPDIFDNSTLVVFVHELGNLRVELQSVMTCNVQVESSYLIDFSKELISWVKREGYSLLDVNLFPKPPLNPNVKLLKSSLDILTYLWDNYVQLSGAQRVVLIGHGPGCDPLITLLNDRSSSIQKTVKAILQIVGHSSVPRIPADVGDLRPWYIKRSFVVLPSNHYILAPDSKRKTHKLHGVLFPLDEPQATKLIMRALPRIQKFVEEELQRYPVAGIVGRTKNS